MNKTAGIQVRGVDKTMRALKEVGGRGADARPAWPYVFDYFRAEVEGHFDSRGHGEWPGLADATKERDRRGGRDPRIMRSSLALYKSLTVERGKNTLRRKSKLQMRYGTKVFYARFHQEGKGVPKRRVLEVHEGLEKAITRTLELYVVKGEMTLRQRRRR